jgi:hypothetical protein
VAVGKQIGANDHLVAHDALDRMAAGVHFRPHPLDDDAPQQLRIAAADSGAAGRLRMVVLAISFANALPERGASAPRHSRAL